MTIKYPNNRLKEFRLKKQFWIKDVARILNMQCESRISKWEKGTAMPSVENLFKLASLYDVLPHTIYPQLYPELQGDRLQTHRTVQEIIDTTLPHLQ